jgi:energy-coupling factor transporter ATP-binding protein EcfA2/GNAT superfamily N-acetyltransferase
MMGAGVRALRLERGVRHADAPRSAPTRRSCEVAASVGLLLDAPASRAEAVHRDLLAPIRAGERVVITGPSGSGKTTLLRGLVGLAEGEHVRVIEASRVRLRSAPVIDQIKGPMDAALDALAWAGLADARTLVRRPEELSEGQVARLRLAKALLGVRSCGAPEEGERRPRAVLALDGFGDGLDDGGARALAMRLSRMAAGRPSLALAASTSRSIVAEAFGATRRIDLEQSGAATVRVDADAPAPSAADEMHVVEGDARDYAALAHGHYRAGAASNVDMVLTLRASADRSCGALAALVVTHPTLNGAWRDLAWPGRYATGDRRADAARVNAELRRIARVVVDERWRGLGLAERLVRAYLARPRTVCTEAVAAAGRWTSFFRRAGMEEYRLASPERHARLLDALAHAGVERWRLATPRSAWVRAVESRGEAFLERELRRWARASRAASRHAEEPAAVLFERACRGVGARPVAFCHTRVEEAE